MSLQVRQSDVEGITILSLHGRFVLGTETDEMREAVTELLAQQKTKLILDLKQVPFIDSTGLGALVVAHSAFRQAGGAMKLVHLSKRHLELLILTKLSTVFEIFDDEQTAIDSFFPDRAIKSFDILEFVQSREKQGEQTPAAEPPRSPSAHSDS